MMNETAVPIALRRRFFYTTTASFTIRLSGAFGSPHNVCSISGNEASEVVDKGWTQPVFGVWPHCAHEIVSERRKAPTPNTSFDGEAVAIFARDHQFQSTKRRRATCVEIMLGGHEGSQD